MVEFERERILPYTPAQVWAVLADFENHRIWNPYVRLKAFQGEGQVTIPSPGESRGGIFMPDEAPDFCRLAANMGRAADRPPAKAAYSEVIRRQRGGLKSAKDRLTCANY